MSEDAHQTVDEKTGDAVTQAQPLHHLWCSPAIGRFSGDGYIVTLNLKKLSDSEKLQFIELWRRVSVEVEMYGLPDEASWVKPRRVS